MFGPHNRNSLNVLCTEEQHVDVQLMRLNESREELRPFEKIVGEGGRQKLVEL